MKIEEVETQLQSALSSQLQTLLKPLVPPGYRAHFYFYDKNRKKKRKDAAAENWSPESGQIQIWFNPEGLIRSPIPGILNFQSPAFV